MRSLINKFNGKDYPLKRNLNKTIFKKQDNMTNIGKEPNHNIKTEFNSHGDKKIDITCLY